MPRHFSPAWCLLRLIVPALSACPEDGVAEIELSCDEPFDGSDTEGLWTLHASGTREGCKDTRLNGALTITSAEPFVIRGSAIARPPSNSDSDAFIDRILVRAGFDLTAKSAPAKVLFDGFADGSCVSFSVTEALGKGDGLSYQFDGYMSANGLIEGNFTGLGPEDCETHGRFEVDVR